MEIDALSVNLCMEGVFIKELFSVNWLCESGLVDNIEMVVEEYRQTRGLLVSARAHDRNMLTLLGMLLLLICVSCTVLRQSQQRNA